MIPVTLSQLTRLIAAETFRGLSMQKCFGDVFGDAEATRLFVAAAGASFMTRLVLLDLQDVPEDVVEIAEVINARPQ